MNKKFQIIIILAMGFLNTAMIFGQEKLIEKKEYAEVTAKANDNLRGKTYRSTTIYETYSDRNSSPIKSSKSILEVVPPDNVRWLIESNSEKKEIIQTGQSRYVRINGGDWKKSDTSNVLRNRANADVESESYKFIGKNTLNGEIVNIYEEKKKLKSFSGDNNKKQIKTTRFWITENGLLMKTQNETETLNEKSVDRITTVYEYDANIKIEAPIKP